MGILVAGLTVAACSPDKFDGADQAGIPTVEGKDFTMKVSFPETAGVYTVWSFNGATYSTLNNSGYQNNKKGTYTVSLRLGNRNGFSQGAITKEFTFNETKASFGPELNRLKDKEWRIDYSEPAHMACGAYGGDGTGVLHLVRRKPLVSMMTASSLPAMVFPVVRSLISRVLTA